MFNVNQVNKPDPKSTSLARLKKRRDELMARGVSTASLSRLIHEMEKPLLTNTKWKNLSSQKYPVRCHHGGFAPSKKSRIGDTAKNANRKQRIKTRNEKEESANEYCIVKIFSEPEEGAQHQQE